MVCLILDKVVLCWNERVYFHHVAIHLVLRKIVLYFFKCFCPRLARLWTYIYGNHLSPIYALTIELNLMWKVEYIMVEISLNHKILHWIHTLNCILCTEAVSVNVYLASQPFKIPRKNVFGKQQTLSLNFQFRRSHKRLERIAFQYLSTKCLTKIDLNWRWNCNAVQLSFCVLYIQIFKPNPAFYWNSKKCCKLQSNNSKIFKQSRLI